MFSFIIGTAEFMLGITVATGLFGWIADEIKRF